MNSYSSVLSMKSTKFREPKFNFHASDTYSRTSICFFSYNWFDEWKFNQINFIDNLWKEHMKHFRTCLVNWYFQQHFHSINDVLCYLIFQLHLDKCQTHHWLRLFLNQGSLLSRFSKVFLHCINMS